MRFGRVWKGYALLFAGIVLAPGDGTAQGVQDACSYESCALWMKEASWFGRTSVVRGRMGTSVAQLDRSQELQDLFAASDSSRAYYARFVATDRRADRLAMVAATLAVAGLVVEVLDEGEGSSWSIGLELGAAGLLGLGSRPLRRQGKTEIARAIWWYNRQLHASVP